MVLKRVNGYVDSVETLSPPNTCKCLASVKQVQYINAQMKTLIITLPQSI